MVGLRRVLPVLIVVTFRVTLARCGLVGTFRCVSFIILCGLNVLSYLVFRGLRIGRV